MARFGYARVSTDGQSLTAQLAELKGANCARIYQEKISGARADRKQLARLIAEPDNGDVLLVISAGSAGKVNPGPSERAWRRCWEGRRLQIPAGHLGRYDHCTRQADVDGLGRPG